MGSYRLAPAFRWQNAVEGDIMRIRLKPVRQVKAIPPQNLMKCYKHPKWPCEDDRCYDFIKHTCSRNFHFNNK
jgi:hypothetical protein